MVFFGVVEGIFTKIAIKVLGKLEPKYTKNLGANI
jgi:ABC-type Co2+ transport system permease subunit